MEVAAEIEDDLFFADLSKQISLLIMDDDEDPLAHCPSVSLHQAFSCEIHPPVQTQFLYEQICRRESKGTGVFIPQQTQPRRNNKQRHGRFGNSYYAKSQRVQQHQQQQKHHHHHHHENTKNNMMVSQQVLPSTASFRPK
ncbi:hypothetical protein L484_007345 [Morus notabilis]|uniref:Uncharacterized protein n=1 Tax=Morus notabilis TaxID=981085 RepID=W9R5M3_9ROSA|nr:uncharacterized protein LOC21390749 [Morus notabilis]EXB55014.1 hypothetical protein L484_007345 [Morus notabilis]